MTNYNYALYKSLQHYLRPLWIKRSFYLYVGLQRRSSIKRNLRPFYTSSFRRKPLFPLRPSATKHRPNSSPFRGARSFFVTSLIREESLLSFGEPKVQKTPSLSSLPRNDSFPEIVSVPPRRVTVWSLRSTAQRVQVTARLV